MNFFSNKDFQLNESWNIVNVPWKDSEILFIDDIYKYPEKSINTLTLLIVL